MSGEPIESLSPGERRLLDKQVRRKRLSLVFCGVSLAVAAGLLGYHLAAGKLDAPRAVIVLLITLAAKNHLRMFRITTLLEKLSRRGGRDEGVDERQV